ncbi:MAG: peptidyl-tRNA hydrolase Pth2 [Candidatus Diapherotrites archaeon]
MDFKQIIIVRTDLKMSPGKTSAQVAHASVSALEKALKKEPGWVEEWRNSGQEKVVLKVSSKKELFEWFEKLKKLFPAALIKDAGRTQIAPGEATCVGVGPAPEPEIDKFTSELKLL